MDLHLDERVKAKIDRWSAWTSLGATYQKCLFRANTKYRKGTSFIADALPINHQ